MTPTVIIFDFGGVLFPEQPWVGQRPSENRFQQIKQLVIEIYKQREQRIDDNDYTLESFREDLETFNTFNLSGTELEQIYKSFFVINKSLCNELKKMAVKYKVFGLVNEAPKWTELRVYFHKLSDYFDDIYISAYVGYNKPQKEIYKYFLDKTQLSAEQCLFIDDSKENVVSATNLGFGGIHFTSTKDLIHRLKQIKFIPID